MPEDGIINLDLEYTDSTGKRRQTRAEIVFESERFEHTIPDNSTTIRNLIIVSVLVVAFIVWRVIKKKKKKLIK